MSMRSRVRARELEGRQPVTVPCRRASRPPQDPGQPHDHGLRPAHNTGASMNNDMVAFRYSCTCVCMGTGLRRSSERCNDGPGVAILFIGIFPFFSPFYKTRVGANSPRRWDERRREDACVWGGGAGGRWAGGISILPGYHYRSAVLIIYNM